MDHRTSSEAFNQTCSQLSPGSSVSDVSQQTTFLRQPLASDPCPGSQPDSAERIYVLSNCRCPDYTVSPCLESQCTGGGSTNPSGECCPSCSTNCPAAYPTQHRVSGEKAKPTKYKPPVPAPERKQRPKRRTGGTNELCSLCGQMEIQEPGHTICPNCNERIHTAVNSYLQCHCYPPEQEAKSCPLPPKPPKNEQPASGQQVKVLSGDPNLNVIVLQDCQNKQELFDQLAKAMDCNAGQMQSPQPPCYQAHVYNQNNANNCQSSRSIYQNNPLPGYNDYMNYNKGFEQPECRYDMCPGHGFYPGTYDDDRYASRTPFTSWEGPMREDPYPEPYCDDFQDQNMDREKEKECDCTCTCTCNCEFCRKGFETKEKLALLLAQALEIFVQGHQERGNKKPKKKKKKKKNKNEKRKAAGSTDAMSEDPPSRGVLNQSRPWRTAPGKPFHHRPYYPRKRALPQIHVLSQAQRQAHYPTAHNTTARTNSQAHFRSFCSKHHQAPKEPALQSDSAFADGAKQGESRTPTFFLPNCEELRSPQDPGNGFRFGGGGESRRRRRARRRALYQSRQQQAEDNEDQQDGADHQKPGRCNDRAPGGGKNADTLFGLSPIAHYRPGMMKFPVNYLLAGTHYRRSLVRTAAGVTLHQKPYMDKAAVKDLPHFPRQESSHLDCRMPPAKKWL